MTTAYNLAKATARTAHVAWMKAIKDDNNAALALLAADEEAALNDGQSYDSFAAELHHYARPESAMVTAARDAFIESITHMKTIENGEIA